MADLMLCVFLVDTLTSATSSRTWKSRISTMWCMSHEDTHSETTVLICMQQIDLRVLVRVQHDFHRSTRDGQRKWRGGGDLC